MTNIWFFRKAAERKRAQFIGTKHRCKRPHSWHSNWHEALSGTSIALFVCRSAGFLHFVRSNNNRQEKLRIDAQVPFNWIKISVLQVDLCQRLITEKHEVQTFQSNHQISRMDRRKLSVDGFNTKKNIWSFQPLIGYKAWCVIRVVFGSFKRVVFSVLLQSVAIKERFVPWIIQHEYRKLMPASMDDYYRNECTWYELEFVLWCFTWFRP